MICKHAPYILTCDTFIGNTVAHSHPHHCFIKRKSGREITIFSSQTSHHTRCVSRVTCDVSRVCVTEAGWRVPMLGRGASVGTPLTPATPPHTGPRTHYPPTRRHGELKTLSTSLKSAFSSQTILHSILQSLMCITYLCD